MSDIQETYYVYTLLKQLFNFETTNKGGTNTNIAPEEYISIDVFDYMLVNYLTDMENSILHRRRNKTMKTNVRASNTMKARQHIQHYPGKMRAPMKVPNGTKMAVAAGGALPESSWEWVNESYSWLDVLQNTKLEQKEESESVSVGFNTILPFLAFADTVHDFRSKRSTIHNNKKIWKQFTSKTYKNYDDKERTSVSKDNSISKLIT